ncbi:MAG: DUF5011 domain-containing protein [Bacilli bacterium]|nr:DUF5011 domain-containing protein [Bacilli bacterium]
MYFKEKEDTNIDKEFEKNKKVSFNFDFKNLNPKLLLFIGVGIIFLLIVIFIITSLTKNNNDDYTIELVGGENITINLGDEYIEPGYSAYDKKDNDITNKVEITSTVDTTKAGEYEVLYSVGKTNVIRYVKVVENIDVTYIYLLGKKDMYIEIGEKYTEPGYEVYDSKEQNLTEKVTITGKVDVTKVGTYRLTYTVVNSRNITTSVVRTVIVVEKGKKTQN